MPFLRPCLLALSLLFALPAQAAGDAGWFYRGSDIPADPAWTFGTLPNGLRYAVRRNAMPAGQVSVRVRIDAGALHEEEAERGWAHFVEHMAFRANADFEDKEARHLLESLGVGFGSDSNAFTGATQTVYTLDLPDADRERLDIGLHFLSQALDTARFGAAAVDAERMIVLAEKGRRPELSTVLRDATMPLFFAGLRIAERDPIGTDATLQGATADGLKAFYERWYRPDRATVIVVGDADPAMMEQLIAARFGGWRPSADAAADPAYGAIAEPEGTVRTIGYPGAPYNASIVWLRPYARLPNTKAREKDDLARSLAVRILNRRFEAEARGEARFISASLGQQRQTDAADITSLTVSPQGEGWREGLAQSFAIIADAVAAPPSAAEVARELSNLRTALTSALEGEATVRSPQRAQQLIAAIDGDSIVASAATTLALVDAFVPQMTPDAIGAAMRGLFDGAGPRMVLLGPVEIGPAEAASALAAARAAAPATRLADRAIGFDDLPPLGPPGREMSRERIEDLDVTIVRFADGSTLTFKRTDFEKGSVGVQLRFGHGVAGLAPDGRTQLAFDGLVGSSGLADIDLDGLERLLTGRQIAMSFGVGEDSFVYRGATNGTELADQLRLIATKIAYPRWDAPLFARIRTSMLQNYELAFAAAASRGARELGAVAHPGDARWRPVEKADLAATELADVRAFFDPLLAAGPLEAIVVGDVDLETAVAAMTRTIAALPARPDIAPAPGADAVQPPAPAAEPVTFTHAGDPAQAFAVIGWSTFGGNERPAERRALALAANIFQVRLFERFREVEGASYSPSASTATSQAFDDWGIFYAASELRPENAEPFFRAAREIVADLAAMPVGADEFERAINPVRSGIERRVRTNAYWLGALEDWTTRPERIDRVRDYLPGYLALTPRDVQAAVAAHVAEQGDWSMLVLPAKPADGVR